MKLTKTNKKNSKRIFMLLVTFVLAMLLVGCKGGVPGSELEIDPATGKGKATFYVRVPKNTAPEVGNNFDKEDEEGYIKSPEALLKLFQDAVPAGYTLTMKDEPKMVENDDGDEEDHGNFTYYLTFEFDGIDDYNDKIMKLVGQASWDGANAEAKALAESGFIKIVPATLTVKTEGDKSTVTFTEDLRIIDVVSYWASDLLRSDTSGVWKDLFKDEGPATFGNTINLDLARYSVKFGDIVQEYRHSDDPLVTLTATVDAREEGPAKDDDKDNVGEEVPATGDNPYTIIIAVLLVLFSGAVLVSIKCSKTNSEE